MNKYFRIVFTDKHFIFLPEIKSQNTYNILIDHEHQSEWGYSLLMDMDTIVMTGYTNVLKDGFYRDGVFLENWI